MKEPDIYRRILETVQAEKNKSAGVGSRPYIVAIDGRCAAGKTTLASRLAEELDCAVVHMDHFFLQPYQRTPKRLTEPGGNVDYERFAREVLQPLKEGKSFSYRIFDCGVMDFRGRQEVPKTSVVLVEGAYCCRPEFLLAWDLTVFLDVDREEQRRRIALRGGEESLRMFEERWIPMEERYFRAFQIEEKCRLRGAVML